MADRIPESHVDLLNEPVYVNLATVMPDGQPQVTVVWASYDGEHVLINSTRSRQKTRNVERHPKVSVLAVDPDNPYHYMEIRGEVEEITEEGALDHINQLAHQYAGVDKYYGGVQPPERQNQETRVIYRIKPTQVNTVSIR